MEKLVSIDSVKIGLLNYIEREIISKLPSTKQFVASIGIALVYDKMFDNYLNHTFVKMMDIIDENDMVDIGKIYDVAKTEIRKVGKIEVMGVIFNEVDIDTLYEEINKVK